MDFDDTPDEAAFRSRARAFLDKNARKRDGVGMLYRAGAENPSFRNEAKAWQAKKADAGYAGITWSKEWGGQGGLYAGAPARYRRRSGDPGALLLHRSALPRCARAERDGLRPGLCGGGGGGAAAEELVGAASIGAPKVRARCSLEAQRQFVEG